MLKFVGYSCGEIIRLARLRNVCPEKFAREWTGRHRRAVYTEKDLQFIEASWKKAKRDAEAKILKLATEGKA